MKKCFLAILAIVYISTSVGANIHMHYCMGTLADWGLIHNESKQCSKCGMPKQGKKDNGCCKDEEKFFKNNNDQRSTEAGFQSFQLLSPALTVPFSEIVYPFFPSLIKSDTGSHDPPLINGPAVYIRNRVFLI